MQWLVRMACAMALLCVGFAHQAPAFANGAFIPAELAAYVLPDGTLPVICIADTGSRAHSHDKTHAHGCEACRISSSVLLPSPGADTVARLRIETAAAIVVSGEVSTRTPLSPGRGARAPPRFPAVA